MATIKSYTTIEQSRKLAEFLPIESADMRYTPIGDIHPWVWEGNPKLLETDSTPCWSLAALLGVLPNGTDICKNIEGRYYVHGFFSDNPVDACVDAIKALHERV